MKRSALRQVTVLIITIISMSMTTVGFAAQSQGPAKVAIVAQGGGDYINPVDAMTDLAAWCGIPSATNPCLLQIMPGVYNVSGNLLQMQQFVDIEGSGENTTLIRGYNNVVGGAANAELRMLTVEATISSPECGLAISAGTYSQEVFKLTNVTAIGKIDFSSSAGVLNSVTINSCEYGLHIEWSPVVIEHSKITVANGITSPTVGIQVGWGPNLTMNDVTVSLSGSGYGVDLESGGPSGGEVRVFNSTISGASYGIVENSIANVTVNNSRILNASVSTVADFGVSGSGSVYISNTLLSGGPVITGGWDFRCAGVVDENNVFFPNSCP